MASLKLLYFNSFVRSGWVDLLNANNVTLRGNGGAGYNWSSRAAAYNSSTDANAYYLAFRPTDISPSNGPYVRFHGNPLRCLSTVIDI